MGIFSKYRSTSFKPDNISLNTKLPDIFESNYNQVYPRFRDNRELCLPTSNQKKSSCCTGFSVAGYIEVKNWELTHYPKQFDGELIYKGAKDIDGLDFDGTYIEWAMESAISLGYNKLINKSETIVKINNSIDNIKKAIHEDDVFVGAFMITTDWNQVYKNGNINYSGIDSFIGGHAVLVCGYDEKGIWIQNSWGTEGWGLYGFGHLSWNQVKTQFKYGIRLK